MPHLPDHQTEHDPRLIAAFAAGDAEGADLERAQALVAACDDCAALHHDLRAIAAALPALPAPLRPRDFRLTPEQAASLRQTGWRRLLAPLAGPRFSFAAPLGGSLAALGLAGVLIAGAASTPIAGTGGAREGTAAQTERMAAEASAVPGMDALSGPASVAPSADDRSAAMPAPTAAALAPAASDAGAGNAAGGGIAETGPAASDSVVFVDGGEGSSTKDELPSAAAIAGPMEINDAPATQSPVSSGVPAVIPVVSAVLLLVGLALLGVAVVRRRMRYAPG